MVKEEEEKRSFTHSPGHSTGNVCVRGKPSKVRIVDWGRLGGREGDGPTVKIGEERECESERKSARCQVKEGEAIYRMMGRKMKLHLRSGVLCHVFGC